MESSKKRTMGNRILLHYGQEGRFWTRRSPPPPRMCKSSRVAFTLASYRRKRLDTIPKDMIQYILGFLDYCYAMQYFTSVAKWATPVCRTLPAALTNRPFHHG